MKRVWPIVLAVMLVLMGLLGCSLPKDQALIAELENEVINLEEDIDDLEDEIQELKATIKDYEARPAVTPTAEPTPEPTATPEPKRYDMKISFVEFNHRLSDQLQALRETDLDITLLKDLPEISLLNYERTSHKWSGYSTCTFTYENVTLQCVISPNQNIFTVYLIGETLCDEDDNPMIDHMKLVLAFQMAILHVLHGDDANDIHVELSENEGRTSGIKTIVQNGCCHMHIYEFDVNNRMDLIITSDKN